MNVLRAQMACVRHRRDLEIRKRQLIQRANKGKVVDSDAYQHIRKVLEPAIAKLNDRETELTRQLRTLRETVIQEPA